MSDKQAWEECVVCSGHFPEYALHIIGGGMFCSCCQFPGCEHDQRLGYPEAGDDAQRRKIESLQASVDLWKQRAERAWAKGDEEAEIRIRLVDENEHLRAEVESLTVTDTDFCDCEEGPHYGAQRYPSLPRCERCGRPADPKRYAAQAENERLRAEVESLTGLLAAFDHVPTLRPTAGDDQ